MLAFVANMIQNAVHVRSRGEGLVLGTKLLSRLRAAILLSGMLLAMAGTLVFHLSPALTYSPVAAWLPSFQLQTARRDFTEQASTVSADVSRAIRFVAARSPLDAAPFYFRAIEAEAAGADETDILPLLNATLERDPRHYYARLWRARIYYRTQRVAEAVDELLRVVPLDRRGEVDYVEALVDVAREPRNHPILLELVAQGPAWAQAFITRAKTEIDDEAFILALTSQSSDAFDRHVRGLIESGEIERAFLIWVETLTEEQLLAFSWPVDPTFARANENVAFGWRSAGKTASRGPEGLHVFHSGRGSREAIAQTMLLGAGYRYRLVVSLTGELQKQGGWFRWQIACAQTQQVLGSLDVREADLKAMPLAFEFVVPSERCDAQVLSLSAEPGDYIHPARLTLEEVRVAQVGAVTGAPASPSASADVVP